MVKTEAIKVTSGDFY